jgi:RimJ/RimL family protein N-acetyltransferase
MPHRGQLVDGWRGTLLATDNRSPVSRWLKAVVLEDDRVRLRALREDDEQRYLETNNDPESLRWLGTIPFPRDAASFRRQFARCVVGHATGSSVEWVVADLTDDRYVGTVAFFGFHSLDHLSAEVGYRTHPDARGRGLLTVGLRLALGHAFTPVDAGGLGLQRVSLGAGYGNLGSDRT